MLLSEALDAPDEAYSMLTDADMTFGTVMDAGGNEIPLTHGNYHPDGIGESVGSEGCL